MSVRESRLNGTEENNERMIIKILTLVQNPLSFDLIDHNCDENIAENHDRHIEEIAPFRFLIASSCIQKLSSFPRNLSWTIDYATRNYATREGVDPHIRDLSYEIIRLTPTPKAILSFLTALINTFHLEHDEDTVFHSLQIYLSAFASCRLNKQILADAAPILKKIPDYLIGAFNDRRQKEIGTIECITPNTRMASQTNHIRQIINFLVTPFIETPETLAISQASEALINILSWYTDPRFSTSAIAAPSIEQTETSLKLIEKLTKEIHIIRLKDSIVQNCSMNCIADLKVYDSHLKRIFISEEIKFEETYSNLNKYILTSEELSSVFTQVIENFRPAGMKLIRQIITTMAQVRTGGVIYAFPMTRLSLLLIEQQNLPQHARQQCNREIHDLFLSINEIGHQEENSPWSFRRAVEFLRLYHRSTHQESIRHTITSLPMHGLPQEFLIRAISRGCNFFDEPSLRYSYSIAKKITEDVVFFTVSAYFSSEYTSPSNCSRYRNRRYLTKQTPLDMVALIKSFFPPSAAMETIGQITDMIKSEEEKLGLNEYLPFFEECLKLN